ncbi:hypothetical protein PCE1_000371 [Barthelona sp. PCE]
MSEFKHKGWGTDVSDWERQRKRKKHRKNKKLPQFLWERVLFNTSCGLTVLNIKKGTWDLIGVSLSNVKIIHEDRRKRARLFSRLESDGSINLNVLILEECPFQQISKRFIRFSAPTGKTYGFNFLSDEDAKNFFDTLTLIVEKLKKIPFKLPEDCSFPPEPLLDDIKNRNYTLFPTPIFRNPFYSAKKESSLEVVFQDFSRNLNAIFKTFDNRISSQKYTLEGISNSLKLKCQDEAKQVMREAKVLWLAADLRVKTPPPPPNEEEMTLNEGLSDLHSIASL